MIRVGYLFNHAEIIGGGELSFLDLADAIRKFGFEPIGIVPGDGDVRSRLNALAIQTVEMAWPPIGIRSLIEFPRAVNSAEKLFRKLGLDLVHANGARCMLYAGPAARRLPVPCLWHVRVLTRDRLLDRIRARYASAIIVNSGAVAAALKPYASASRKIAVIYNGLDLEKFSICKPLDLSREFGLSSAPVVLAAGRFSRWKGFEDLIQACFILNARQVAFNCLLVGKALPGEEEYEKGLVTLARQGRPVNIFFGGWREDLPAIMKSASVMVLPSHGEPFGRVVIEAWAGGLPVVATNRGGPAEIIADGDDGILVPLSDPPALAGAIQRVLAHPDLAQRLREGGARKARQFTLEVHARKIAALYREVSA